MDSRPTEEEAGEYAKQSSMIGQPGRQLTALQSEAQSEGFLKFSLSSEDTLVRIKNHLLGRFWDDTKGDYVQLTKPFCAEEGADLIVGIIGARMHHTTQLSYLNDEEIYDLVKEVGEDINNAIYVYREQYGFVDGDGEYSSPKVSIALNFGTHNVLVTLKRARRGMESRNVRATVEQRETNFTGLKPKEKGLFSLFKQKGQ